MRAYSPADVVAGEAVSGTPAERHRDMMAIASAMVNRARALGVSLNDVVANPNEFNAYAKSLPPGADKYRSMAQDAIDSVMKDGPIHTGMFYATPKAVDNLPGGLTPVGATKGHQFFADPQGRAIGTAKGYRTPSMEAEQQLSQIASMKDTPTPTARTDPSFQAAPVGAVEAGGMLAAPMSMKDNYDAYAQGRMGLSPKSQLARGLLSQAQDMAAAKQAQSLSDVAAAAKATPGYAAAKAGLASELSATNHVRDTIDGLPSQPKGLNTSLGFNFAPAPMDTPAFARMAQPPTSTVAPTPGYVDTQVSVNPAATAYTPPAAAYTPAAAAVDSMATGGLLSAGPQYDAAAAKAAAAANTKAKAGNIAGAVGGALLGGLLAGPLGGLLGGYLGKQAMGKAMGYPNKPDKARGGDLDPSHRASVESRSNQDAVSRSPQAQAAKNSGKAGLF